MEPATELSTLPQREGAHHIFFHLCIAIAGFLARLFELKSGCYTAAHLHICSPDLNPDLQVAYKNS